MSSSAQDVVRHSFQASDRLLLDANVWLSLFGPQSLANRNAAKYALAFRSILLARCRVHVDSLIMSEFVNRYARAEHRLILKAGNVADDFKRFRGTPDFLPIAHRIAAAARDILRHCTRIESGFSQCDVASLLREYEQGNRDFNDQIVAELCKREGLALITDDADFKGQDIAILTANQRLLAMQ